MFVPAMSSQTKSDSGFAKDFVTTSSCRLSIAFDCEMASLIGSAKQFALVTPSEKGSHSELASGSVMMCLYCSKYALGSEILFLSATVWGCS